MTTLLDGAFAAILDRPSTSKIVATIDEGGNPHLEASDFVHVDQDGRLVLLDGTWRKSRKMLELPIRVREEDLLEWLGPKRFHNEVSERITVPGVTTGLVRRAAPITSPPSTISAYAPGSLPGSS